MLNITKNINKEGIYFIEEKIYPLIKIKTIIFMKKSELFSFIKENPTYCRESYFSSKFPSFYADVLSWSFPADFKFSQKLYHYFRDDFNLQIGLCPVCGNRCKYIKFGKRILFTLFV